MNVVYVPCSDKTEARKIAKELLRNKLAICINIIDKVKSIFRWKGKIKESTESLIIIKTSSKLVGKVINQIKKLHSYNIPDIISWKIDKTTSQVKNWCDAELK